MYKILGVNTISQSKEVLYLLGQSTLQIVFNIAKVGG